MSAFEFIQQLPKAFVADAASGTHCTIQFNVAQPAHIVIKDGTCSVVEGKAEAADLGITMDDADLIALFKGELNGMTAFMTGKLQVDGDLMLAQRLNSFFDASRVA
jgi:putative sterol carrier protein